MVKVLPPLLLRAVMDAIGFVTESLQLPLPFLGVEARRFGSDTGEQCGHLRPRLGRRPGTDFLPRALRDHNGCGDRQGVGRRRSTAVRPVLPLTISLGPPVRRRLPGGDDGPHLPRVPGRSRRLRPGSNAHPAAYEAACFRGFQWKEASDRTRRQAKLAQVRGVGNQGSSPAEFVSSTYQWRVATRACWRARCGDASRFRALNLRINHLLPASPDGDERKAYPHCPPTWAEVGHQCQRVLGDQPLRLQQTKCSINPAGV